MPDKTVPPSHLEISLLAAAETVGHYYLERPGVARARGTVGGR